MEEGAAHTRGTSGPRRLTCHKSCNALPGTRSNLPVALPFAPWAENSTEKARPAGNYRTDHPYAVRHPCRHAHGSAPGRNGSKFLDSVFRTFNPITMLAVCRPMLIIRAAARPAAGGSLYVIPLRRVCPRPYPMPVLPGSLDPAVLGDYVGPTRHPSGCPITHRYEKQQRCCRN